MKTEAIALQARIASERKRTNILSPIEQPVIAYLCSIMPYWVTPNILTGVGMVANFIVFLGFYLGKDNPLYLGIAVIGLAINWFGDSLDGRLAYFRNIPRKWYGFTLDMCMDWVSTLLMGLGFYYFLPESQKLIALLFIAAYSWSMIIALMRYNITGTYAIDTGLVGPTELRIVICLVFLAAMFFPQILPWVAGAIVVIVMSINIMWFREVLHLGDVRDEQEKQKKKIDALAKAA